MPPQFFSSYSGEVGGKNIFSDVIADKSQDAR